MDSQLQWLLDQLKEHEVPCWLDSGTLLGLMREGRLLTHDQDIDLGLWAKHEAALQGLLPHFRKAGYRVFSAGYRGFTFQYKLSPKEATGPRVIDVNLFRRCGEFAWCPGYYFKIQPGSTGGKKSDSAGALRSILRFFWRKLIARVPVSLSISALPWRLFVNHATWWIPAAYFDNLEFNAGLGAHIPADWESYLEFRYGDWRIPREDWVFHREDGGLLAAPPAEACIAGMDTAKK